MQHYDSKSTPLQHVKYILLLQRQCVGCVTAVYGMASVTTRPVWQSPTLSAAVQLGWRGARTVTPAPGWALLTITGSVVTETAIQTMGMVRCGFYIPFTKYIMYSLYMYIILNMDSLSTWDISMLIRLLDPIH